MDVRTWLVGLGMTLQIIIVCGCQNAQIGGAEQAIVDLGGNHGSIVGGAPVHAFDDITKSTVAFYFPVDATGTLRNFCTGTLISHDLVLTAAHCFVDVASGSEMTVDQLAQFVFVGFGNEVVSTFKQDQVSFRQISQIIPHESYVENGFLDAFTKSNYDIALVRLKTKAPKGFKPARLATHPVKAKQPLVIAGFGLTDGKAMQRAVSLNKTDIIVEQPQLNEVQFLYVNSNGQTACSGDSGGPAYETLADGTLMVHGVTSFGDSTCERFGVYTHVFPLVEWIRKAAMTPLRRVAATR